jgi:hypothetical protein
VREEGHHVAERLVHDPAAVHERPYEMAAVRGRVTRRLEGEAAFAVIDRIAHTYTGAPYPLRTGRVVFLVEPERAWAESFG